jgi:lipopolysaccharide transport protein LptA/LPS export ABC transporter protein LptC
MASRATHIARLRSLLLAVLVLAVAAVVGLYLFGKAGRQRGKRGPEEETKAAKGVTLVGEDFDYTFSEKERPIFRIKGDSIRADREGTLFLDGVGVTFYDPQGNEYHVESQQASFNRSSNEGLLRGDVVLKGPSQLELRTPQLQIRDNGHILLCPRQVEIRYVGQYVANGDRLRVELPGEVFILQGNARVASLPGAPTPVAASAQRAIYERQRKLLRIEGDAHLRRGAQKIQAQRISAYLSDDESSLVFVRGLWDVAGESAGQGGTNGGTTVRFAGKDLAVMLQPQGNEVRQVDLEGGAQDRAMIETVGGGIQRTMNAFRFEGVLNQGVLSKALGFQGVDIKETVKGGAVRTAHGKHAEASFTPDGHLAAVQLEKEVSFQDPQVNATGDRAAVDFAANRGELFGSPVMAKSDRGTLNAPRLVYDTDRKILHAQGGVRAVLEKVSDSALAGSPLAEGEGPVQVESKEAFWRQDPSSFLFRGDVRSWRGENLMLSQELTGDKAQDRLTATGGVKTLWIPTDQPGAGKTGGGKTTGATEMRRAPITVVASDMAYQQGSRLLTYTGAVHVEQEGKTLDCQKLDVQMNEQKKPQKMTCTGQAKLNDPKAGRTIEGGTAVYLLDRRQVEFTGDKVTMKDKDGNQVQGRRVLYSIDDGKVQVQGKDQGKDQPAAGAGVKTTG